MSIFNRTDVKMYVPKHMGSPLFEHIAKERFNLTVTTRYYGRECNIYMYDMLIYRKYSDTSFISTYTEHYWGNKHFCNETKEFINSLLQNIDSSVEEAIKNQKYNKEREEKRSATRLYKLLKANQHIG
jgi:hypothetical protein